MFLCRDRRILPDGGPELVHRRPMGPFGIQFTGSQPDERITEGKALIVPGQLDLAWGRFSAFLGLFLCPVRLAPRLRGQE